MVRNAVRNWNYFSDCLNLLLEFVGKSKSFKHPFCGLFETELFQWQKVDKCQLIWKLNVEFSTHRIKSIWIHWPPWEFRVIVLESGWPAKGHLEHLCYGILSRYSRYKFTSLLLAPGEFPCSTGSRTLCQSSYPNPLLHLNYSLASQGPTIDQATDLIFRMKYTRNRSEPWLDNKICKWTPFF